MIHLSGKWRGEVCNICILPVDGSPGQYRYKFTALAKTSGEHQWHRVAFDIVQVSEIESVTPDDACEKYLAPMLDTYGLEAMSMDTEWMQ